MLRTNSDKLIESNRKEVSRNLYDSNLRPPKAGAKSVSPLSKSRTYNQTNDPVLLKRSEEVFNAQSASQKMKIFNEME